MDKVVPILKSALSGARPAPRDAHEALALAVRCVGVTRSLPDAGEDAGVPPQGWNDGDDVIEMAFERGGPVLKLLKMGPVLLVHGVARPGAPDVASLDLTVADYVNEGAPLDDANRAFTLGLAGLVGRVNELFDKLGGPGAGGGGAAAAAKPADPLQADPLRADPLRADPLRVDPLRADPLRADPLRAEPGPGRPWDPTGGLGRGDLDPFHRGGGMLLDPRSMPQPPGVMPPAGRGRVPGARFDPIFPDGPMGPMPPGAGYRAGPDPNHLPMPPDADDLDMFG